MIKLIGNYFILGVMIMFIGCVSNSKHHSIDHKIDAEKRAKKILKEMTLEEKIDYIGGFKDLNIRAIERLGLPQINMSDGPMGLRNYEPTTMYPGGIALAATWNTELAAKFGKAVGHDARARGVHIWLAPGLNIYRYPTCGRNFEYFGEDPYLASCMAVEVIKNFQNEGNLATAKHYACNSNEYGRMYISSEIDERTLREIYLPAFQASVIEGKVGCVMSAYNLVNGVYCTENEFLNKKILKGEWGFEGILMSDWGATHNGIAAANGGLDLEMPSGAYMNRNTLLPAIKEGKVSLAAIDDKVYRILKTIIQAGFLDRPQKIESIPLDNPESAQTALQIAREAIVLLKNEKDILPLSKAKIHSIAVLGPNAHPNVPAGGGSSFTKPFHSVSFLDGIKSIAGKDIEINFDPGCEFPNAAILADHSKFEHIDEKGVLADGLIAEYFDNKDLAGEPKVKCIVPKIYFDWGKGAPENLPVNNFSARWTGLIRPKKSGLHIFSSRTDDGVRVYLNNELIIDDWTDHAVQVKTVTKELQEGNTYALKVEFYEHEGDAVAQFGWDIIQPLEDSPAIALARKADIAIVCVGFNNDLETEGADRAFALPGGQEAFIKEVVKVNPKTIVVLNSGGSVAWDNWLEKIPALVQVWYPGQEGGTALAEILFGITNPSGKLPATFEKQIEDNPAHKYYFSKDNKTSHYTEGIFVGYRGYEKNNIKPQFCFGYGLSYTTFKYSGLNIKPAKSSSGKKANVSFTIKNTGQCEGAEIAQIYLHDIESRLPRPKKELKAFKKVFLNRGESKTIEIELGKEAFSYFDPERKEWIAEPGMFEILVGSSSQDIRLSGKFNLK